MKSLAFISIHDSDINKQKFTQILRFIINNYSLVYILKNENDYCKNVFKNIGFITKFKNTNDDESNSKIIIIEKINPLIKYYSHRIFINGDGEDEKKLNIHVDYSNFFIDKKTQISNINDVILKKLHTFSSNLNIFKNKSSVLVMDLDNTIIDRDSNLLFDEIGEVLRKLTNHFDYFVLWSHGCSRHVNNCISTVLKETSLKFDLIISKMSHMEPYNKGFGYVFKLLNSKFGICNVSYCALIDDQASNYIGDYDHFLQVPLDVDKNIYETYVDQLCKIINKNKICDVLHNTN